MRFSRRFFKPLLCSFAIFLVSRFMTYPFLSQAVRSESPMLLKYEINDVYVGNLKHIIRILNGSPTPVKGELFIPLIRNVTERHYVILQNVSLSKVDDSSGNIYFHRDNVKIDAGQNFTIELNYHVLSFSIQYLIDSSIVEDYDTSSSLYKKYVEPEELVECDNSKIVTLAHNLTDTVDDMHEKALKIYNFIHRYMNYESQDEERGASWALENRVGDCSEYSYLFVALCRAAGIPARIQAGFAFHHATETLEDGHMWAEYYLGNYGWIPVDVTWRLFDVTDNKHFSSIQSVPELISYANYVFDYKAEKKNLKEEQSVSLTPCSANVFDDNCVEHIVKTIKMIRQEKTAIFLGKTFLAHLIFQSEFEEIDQTFLESKFQLQNAIDLWCKSPKTAESNAISALEDIEETLQNTWLIIAKTFMIFTGISMIIMLIGLLFLKRSQTQAEKEPTAEISST